MSIFGVKASDAKREKLPTIRQFCKSTAKSKYKSDGIVELVWLPGNFDNFTIQTDRFRILITKNHPFYQPLLDFFDGVNDRSCGFRVEISDWKSAEYIFHELSEGNGAWETIGESGYRWTQ